jgi:predicted phage terminase large subunit-like protein
MASNRRALAALQDEMLTRRAVQSLRVFVEWAWPILEPATAFRSNWHIDYICEQLEAVTAGEIRRLLITIPPRYMKSILTSVCWPCWEWAQCPSTRWIFASYAETLASRHSLDRRRLLCSDWYQQRWGDRVRLVKDQHAKMEFHNTRRGAMVAASVGGSITGKGGNRIVLDDPHNPTQAESDAQRTHAIDFFQTTLSTRLDDPQRDAIVVVMQRLHTRDLAAVCLEQGFEHVCIPAIATAPATIRFPRSGQIVTRDVDTALWPARHTREDLEKQRGILGSYAFAGQYQQEPVPRNGELFRREWWQWVDTVPARYDQLLQSWDLSFKAGSGSDYVVGLVAGRIGTYVYILDRFKAKASFVETCQAIKQMVARYPKTGEVLIEDTANGPAVVDALRQQVRGIVAVKPDGGKLARASAVQPQLEARQVFLPQPRWPDGRLRPEYAWVEDFVDMCAMFPKGDHDDDVDALSQLLLRCRKRSGVSAGDVIRMMSEEDDEHDVEEKVRAIGSVRYGGFKPFRS